MDKIKLYKWIIPLNVKCFSENSFLKICCFPNCHSVPMSSHDWQAQIVWQSQSPYVTEGHVVRGGTVLRTTTRPAVRVYTEWEALFFLSFCRRAVRNNCFPPSKTFYEHLSHLNVSDDQMNKTFEKGRTSKSTSNFFGGVNEIYLISSSNCNNLGLENQTGLHGKAPLLSKKRLIRKHGDHQGLCVNSSGKTKAKPLGGDMTSAEETHHFKIKMTASTVKCGGGGGSVMVWDTFACSRTWTSCRGEWNHRLCRLLKQPWRGKSSVRSWRKKKTGLGIGSRKSTST